MGLCVQCRKFLPPGFLEEESDGDLRCLFCKRDTDEIRYGEGNISKKSEVIKEYDIFLKMVREDSGTLKRVAKGGTGAPSIIIP